MKHVPTFPTASTATSTASAKQQDVLNVARVTLKPAAPRTVAVLRVPLASRTDTRSTPVPPEPSLTVAVNSHVCRLQLPVQLASTLISSHIGAVTSITLKMGKSN